MAQLVSFVVNCGFGIWIFFIASLFDGLMHHPVMELGHVSFVSKMWTTCSGVYSSVPALVLTFIASSFPEHSNLGMHGIEGTTHFSRFARASDITLRYSV